MLYITDWILISFWLRRILNFNIVRLSVFYYCFWILLHVFFSLPGYKGMLFMFSSNDCKASF